jgi:hypothetical protein
MPDGPFTRRQALQAFAAGAEGIILDPQTRGASESTSQIQRKPVEIVSSSVSPSTVRIQVSAADGSTPPVLFHGALVQEQWGKPIARLRGQSKGKGLRCGNLTVSAACNPNPGQNRAACLQSKTDFPCRISCSCRHQHGRQKYRPHGFEPCSSAHGGPKLPDRAFGVCICVKDDDSHSFRPGYTTFLCQVVSGLRD